MSHFVSYLFVFFLSQHYFLMSLFSTFLSVSCSFSQWFPDSGSRLLAEMGMQEDILTGHMFPDEYRRLFELIEKSPDFKNSWLYGEVPENIEFSDKLTWV